MYVLLQLFHWEVSISHQVTVLSLKFFNFTEWFKWEKRSETIPVHCLAGPWCPRTPNTILGFPKTSQDLQPTWCWTYGCTLQVNPEFLSKCLMSRLLVSVLWQMKTSSSVKETFEHCKLWNWVCHCQLGWARILLGLCKEINFRIPKGLQGECLQGEYKSIYGIQKVEWKRKCMKLI